nr:sigma 54-interacting transcriptional regulator [Vibrio sinus]
MTAFYLQAIEQHWQLSCCYLLHPSPDGRHLTTRGNENHDDGLQLEWSVDDFDQPFAHVVQQAKLMLISQTQLAFWQQNQSFITFSSQVKRNESLLILPLLDGANHVKSMVVVIGEQTRVGHLLSDEYWQQFADMYLSHRLLLQDIKSQHEQKQVLNESLSRLMLQRNEQCNGFDLSQHLLGASTAMEQLRDQIAVAAKSNLTVLIQGETGVGKELVAKAVHALSDKHSEPFVVINCAAIPENLLESELFGYEKGAFTGALKSRTGLIAQADGGTLFLDEMGELPIALQAKLLRVLETYQYRPLGSNQERSSRFRLIAATHVNLRQSVDEGSFRLDLYYRLYQYPLFVPNLQSRAQDIELLSSYFIDQYNARESRNVAGLSKDVLDVLKTYDYPGNVRELRSLVEFACVQTPDTKYVQLECLPADKQNTASSQGAEGEFKFGSRTREQKERAGISDLKLALEAYEKQIIVERLRKYNGHRAKTAESLGLPKRTLAHKCQKLEIQ